MGWGPWGYCLHRGDFLMPHANGAGSTALHATDALRFGYCLLHKGKWKDQQLVPADYIELCHKPLPYNPHTPFSLQFEHNSDGHAIGAPRDAFFKSGAGGFCIFIVPSLDLVIYKLGGKDNQYDPALPASRSPSRVMTAITGNRPRYALRRRQPRRYHLARAGVGLALGEGLSHSAASVGPDDLFCEPAMIELSSFWSM